MNLKKPNHSCCIIRPLEGSFVLFVPGLTKCTCIRLSFPENVPCWFGSFSSKLLITSMKSLMISSCTKLATSQWWRCEITPVKSGASLVAKVGTPSCNRRMLSFRRYNVRHAFANTDIALRGPVKCSVCQWLRKASSRMENDGNNTVYKYFPVALALFKWLPAGKRLGLMQSMSISQQDLNIRLYTIILPSKELKSVIPIDIH